MLALGCPANYMNLLVKEIPPNNVMKYVVEISKFFQNHHRPLGSLIEKESQRPQIPNETRWKSEKVFISIFMYNYLMYIEISIEQNDELKKIILSLQDNKILSRMCQFAVIITCCC